MGEIFPFCFQQIADDHLHATIHCVSCSFFCRKMNWLYFFFRTDCRSLLFVSVFLCFQERCFVWEIEELSKAVGFIVFPFIAYLVSYVSRKIYTCFEENAY